jgi:glycosyltransferase involved in cell wall biosynthesis
VPACNEAALINRTLASLSQAAVDGYIELIVVCNGCTDDTADLARNVSGVRVLELAQGSKPAALNAGDDVATLWPRLYLDADIQISAEAALEVLDRLAHDDVLAARPDYRYDMSGASALVRSYYRAIDRIRQRKWGMWGAGAYGLSEQGHERLGAFPTVTGDDLYVDTLFTVDEKTVVFTDPVIVKTPTDVTSLLAILRRSHRGNAELLADRQEVGARMRDRSVETAVMVLRSIRGPRSAADAAVFLGMAVAKRFRYRNSRRWERDESSRSPM